MTLAHIAGAPVEELVVYVATSCAGAIVAIRVRFGRWFPLRSARSPWPELPVDFDPDLAE